MLKSEAKTTVQSPRAAVRPSTMARKPVFGPKAVGSFIPRLTRPAFEKFGFSAATLITDWAQIVGAGLADSTQPERLRWPKAAPGRGEAVEDVNQGRPGATLLLRVDNGRALDIQYKGRQIIDRINAYFGYRAVTDLRIVQAPITRSARPASQAPKPLVAMSPPPAEVSRVENAELRDALARMAAGLNARNQKPKHSL